MSEQNVKIKGVDLEIWKQKIRNRSDLTFFLTHLTKPTQTISEIKNQVKDPKDIKSVQQKIYELAVDNLINILKSRKLLANNDKTIKGDIPVVCFQEVPWEILREVEEEVWNEYSQKSKIRYCGVGISFDKFSMYRNGVRPVIYDKKTEFLRNRSKYIQLSDKQITDKRKSIQGDITFLTNRNYIPSQETLKEENEIRFIEEISKLKNSTYSNQNYIEAIIEIAKSWFKRCEKIGYVKLGQYKLEEYLSAISNQKMFYSEVEKSEKYDVIVEQKNTLINLFEWIHWKEQKQDERIVVLKEIINNYLNNYFIHKSKQLDEEDFIWRMVEFELSLGHEEKAQRIVDFTFEREWRKKGDLSISFNSISSEHKMVLIFPNKPVYDYFKNKVNTDEEIKSDKELMDFLENMGLYNETDNTYISYILLNEYLPSYLKKLRDTLINKGINDDVINDIIKTILK